MPIYEYQCRACGHRLEKLQRISDDPLTDCPACSKPELSKLVSAAGFRLKGGGWYETDFKKGGRKNVAGAGDTAGSSGDTGSKDSGAGESRSTDSKSSDGGDTSSKGPKSDSAAASS